MSDCSPRKFEKEESKTKKLDLKEVHKSITDMVEKA
tara:strand:- start:369 stop:476 length:108 start_codon:yes stop_codon:yes gene_type:complete